MHHIQRRSHNAAPGNRIASDFVLVHCETPIEWGPLQALTFIETCLGPSQFREVSHAGHAAAQRIYLIV
ncbi:Uncharacterised protein [Mycobacteroides abscessus subsp. abscessus]|nr:Uncharacterised protein [Mycobacteroides abscessus subsp. abscessus]